MAAFIASEFKAWKDGNWWGYENFSSSYKSSSVISMILPEAEVMMKGLAPKGSF
jgi:hypothetical protein